MNRVVSAGSSHRARVAHPGCACERPLRHQLKRADPFALVPTAGSFSAELAGEFSFSSFPNAILEALHRGLESVAIKLAIVFGYRDEVALTTLAFGLRVG